MKPSGAAFSNVPAQHMLKRLKAPPHGGAASMRCVQEAGDVLFLPGDWGHTTLNMAASVGIAKEFGIVGMDSPEQGKEKKKKKKKKKKGETKKAPPVSEEL